MHRRATPSPSKTSVNTGNSSTILPISNNGSNNGSSSLSSSPQKKRKRKRPRSRNPIQKALSILLGFGIVGFGLLFLGLLYSTLLSSSSSNAGNDRRFLLTSTEAPQCSSMDTSAEIDFTLVTQLSDDRLWMMEHHCQRYPHKTSIAVYTNNTYDETIQRLVDDYHCDLSKLDVSVVDAQTVGSFSDYPVNYLRNQALSKVKTSHIVYIDVDFWTSNNLYETLTLPSVTAALWEDPKLALVIPAFMLFRQCTDYVDCRENNIPRMPHTKTQLVDLIQQKRGHIFDPTNRGGHGSTRYGEWLRQEQGELVDIDCLISKRYEPFVVVRYCQDLPPFQPAFSGYGKNKMTWMMHVLRKGYQLKQVGETFLVHYPHLDSASRTTWNQAPDVLVVKDKRHKNIRQVRRPKASDGDLPFGDFKRGQIDQLYVDFRHWLNETVPDETKVQLCDVAQDDDSKLWIEHKHNTIADIDDQEDAESGGSESNEDDEDGGESDEDEHEDSNEENS